MSEQAVTIENCWGDAQPYDYDALVEGLNRYLRLKALPIRHETL